MDDPDALFIPSPQEPASLVNSWRRLRIWKQFRAADLLANPDIAEMVRHHRETAPAPVKL